MISRRVLFGCPAATVLICALGLPAPIRAQALLDCTHGPGKAIAAPLVFSNGGFGDQPQRNVVLLLLPGGVAEYSVSGTCTVLAFTAVRNGEAVYTDDGLGRGLTVSVGKDGKFTIAHAAGWTAESQ